MGKTLYQSKVSDTFNGQCSIEKAVQNSLIKLTEIIVIYSHTLQVCTIINIERQNFW